MHFSPRLRPPRRVLSTVYVLVASLCLWSAQPSPANASSMIFGGGPFYTGGTATMNTLRASGYTTVMLWCIHVDAITGKVVSVETETPEQQTKEKD